MPSGFVVFGILAAVAATLVTGLLVGPRWFAGTRAVRMRFWCPERRDNVRVAFQVAAWSGTAVDVHECSVFQPPTAVTCDKACLR